MRTFSLSAAGAFSFGYLAVRSVEALRADARPLAHAGAAAYGRFGRRAMVAGIARSLASSAVTAFALAPALAPRLASARSAPARIAWIAGDLLLASLLELPIDFVEDHLVERRFGLTEQSARAWFADRAKATVLVAAVGAPLSLGLVAVRARAPRRWPLLVALGSLPLLVVANLVVPLYVMPLFNAFEPYDGPLAGPIRALAARYGVADPTLLRVDLSRQTKKANAYVTGLLGTHRIVLGDTLLANFADDEILFVTAHELGHYVAKDTWRSVVLGALATAVILGGGELLLAERSEAPADGPLVALARIAFAASLVSSLVGPVLARSSRDRERAADRFATTATGDPLAGARAFTRLREQNLAEDEQPRWMETLFSSHPSLRSRIAALETAAAQADAVR